MSTKVSFDVNGLGYIDPENGTHTFDIDSNLGHRFKIIDGLAQDIYHGVSDEEVKRMDHVQAQQERQEKIANGEQVEALPPLNFEGEI